VAPGNVSVLDGATNDTIGVISVSGGTNEVDFTGTLYEYANLTLPYSPNDPGLSFTFTGVFTPADFPILRARFINLLNEPSLATVFGPGNVVPINPPIIFEPPLRMCLSGLPELWCVISDTDPNYRGCFCYMSTDGGQTYSPAKDLTGSGIVFTSAATGFVISGDFPAHVDVDPDDFLALDLSESNGSGVLTSYTLADQNNFRYPSYLSPSGALNTGDPGWVSSVSGNAGYDFYGGLEPNSAVHYKTPPCDFGLMATHTRGLGMSIWGNGTGGAPAYIFTPCGEATSSGSQGFGGPDDEGDIAVFPCNPGCCGTDVCSGVGQGGYTVGTVVNPARYCNNCPAQAAICYQGALGNIVDGAPDFFQYDLESISAGIVNTGGYGGVVTQTFFGKGITVGPVTFDDVTFPADNNLGWQSINFFGGGGVISIVKMVPRGVGHSLYVAFVMGAAGIAGTSVVPGWTLITPGLTCGVWAAHGPALNVQLKGLYELIHHQQVNSISGNMWEMQAPVADGGPIRRAVFSQPFPGVGEDHPIGSRFGWLNDRLISKPAGVIKIPLDAAWISQDLHFKFPAFSTGGIERLEPTQVYSYAPTGLAFGQFSPQPTYIQTPLQALLQTDANTVTMPVVTENFAGNLIRYNARTFTIGTPPSLGQTYYVTIYDPFRLGDLGQTVSRPSFIDTTQDRLLTTGYIYIGSVVAVPTGFAQAIVTPGGWPPGQVLLVNGV
jgi:hypothetical protein